MDTEGCPTTFTPPTCQEQTAWTLEKTLTTSDTVNDPDDEPYVFTVTVTEGATTTVLTGGGQIVITNSGDLSAVLSSIVVNLERPAPGAGNAPGPSGKNWLILRTAIASEAGACVDQARTCYGKLTATAGASLVLIDPDNNDVIALNGVLPIPATIDNDGDGLRDEDPVDGVNNDGDSMIDEDGACMDAVIFNFEYEFDISGLGLVAGAPLRINLMATFGGAGSRGKSPSSVSCTVDANCNGVIDEDDPNTPLVDESETDNVRTVQQRGGFPMPECERTCDSVTLIDMGAVSADPGCVSVTNGTAPNEMIAATGVEGTQTIRNVTGNVSCVDGDCSTVITNTAVLSCDDDSLISGSPATASFAVTCMGADPPMEVADFCTQTQGGWGTQAFGNNIGTLRRDNFPDVFPDPLGLVIGDLGGPNASSRFSLILTRHWRVSNFLPTGGPPGCLTADLIDPVNSSAGVFAGQLVAATINVAFDAADPQIRRNGAPAFPPGTLGLMTYEAGCVHAGLVGETVNQVIAWANEAISGVALGDIAGLPAGVTKADLNNALAVLNENFVDCGTDLGCLALPPGVSPLAPPPTLPGDFCTQTQSDWGLPGAGAGSIGTLRNQNFVAEFPNGLVMGDLGGPNASSRFAILLTTSASVARYLPQGGPPGPLTVDLVNPTVSASGVFGGQLVAAVINVAFDAANPQVRIAGAPGFPPGTLGQMTYVAGCVDAGLVGQTVNQVIAWSHERISGVALGAIAGLPAGVSTGDLNNALRALNDNFDDCDTDLGCLALPPGVSPLAPPPAPAKLGRDDIIRGILRTPRQASPEVGALGGSVLRPRLR